MADEPTITREQELAEQFKEGLDPASAGAMALRLEAAEAMIAQLQSERDAANEQAEKAAKAATAAKAKVTRSEVRAKPRKLGPIDDGLTGEALIEALSKADADDKRVEIVVSDGALEVTGIPPFAISGDVWRDHPLGRMLRDPIQIQGQNTCGAPLMVHGFALLIDGKQVAYCERPEVVQVWPGQTINFADDIYF